MKNLVDYALSYDPLYEMEKMVGKNHYSEFNEEENGMAFLLNMMSGNAKREILKQAKDTYSMMSWDEFIALVKSHGFKEAMRYDFIDNQYSKVKTEEIIVFYDDNGFIIWSESYDNKSRVHGGDMYGQILVDEDFDRCGVLSGCSNRYFADNKMSFSKDIREGLINTLNKVKGNSVPLKAWENKELLWFVDYMERKVEGYDYKTITQDKLSRCCKEAQDIMRVCIN